MEEKELLFALGGLYLRREEIANGLRAIDAQIDKTKLDLLIARKVTEKMPKSKEENKEANS